MYKFSKIRSERITKHQKLTRRLESCISMSYVYVVAQFSTFSNYHGSELSEFHLSDFLNYLGTKYFFQN